jgi:hypothetical protein
MNKIYKTSKLAEQSGYLVWFMLLLGTFTVAGCGSGDRDPILGNTTGTVIVVPEPPVIVAPTVTVTVPQDTTPIVTGVAVGSNITAEFSKDMDPAAISTSSFTLACPVGTPIAGTVTPDTSRIATFDPTSNLPFDTECTATITTAAQDTEGTPLANDFVWQFRTGIAPDTTRPRVSSTVPFNTAEDVAFNIAITATFTEDMAPATITDTSFTLTGPGVTVVDGGVSYAVGARTATFAPADDLPASTLMTATVTAAATDLAGNALAGNQAALPAASDYVWTFTTGAAPDTTAPTITLENPADLAIDVAINSNVNATFSEPMDQLTITKINFTLQETGPPLGSLIDGIVTYNNLTNIAIFNPADDLQPGTSYTATVSSDATDLAGNNLVAGSIPNPWTFTTAAAVVVPPPPLAIDLGAATSFGIASRAGLTSTGVTVVNGDVALHPLATCTDSTGNAGASQTCLVQTYSSPTGMTVNGSIYWAGDPFDNGATALEVTDDLNTAWVEGQNKIDTFATGFLGGELGGPGPDGKILLAGVYHEAALGISAGSVATFDAEGDANAIFIIKVDSSFVDSGTLLLPTEIKLANSAQARNIWFVTGLDITIGSGTTWYGNILAGRTIVINDGSTVIGRALGGASGAGAVTLTGAASPSVTTITVPES